jgi:hypothetical protein
VLEEKVAYLQKPLTTEGLARKVRQVLSWDEGALAHLPSKTLAAVEKPANSPVFLSDPMNDLHQ